MNPLPSQRLWTRDYFLAFTILVGPQLVYVTLIAYMALYTMQKFGVSDTAGGFAASSFVLGAAVGRLLIGKFLGFIGRKRALLISLSIFVIGTLIYPLVDLYAWLIVVRILQGTAFGVASTTTSTVAISMLPGGRLSEGVGYLSLAGTLSNALGPVAALQLSQHASSLWVFGFAAVCSTISLIAVVLLRVHEPPPLQEAHQRWWKIRRSDLIDAKTLPVALVALVASLGFALVMTYLAPYMVGRNLADAASLFFLVWAMAMLAVRLFSGRIHDRYGENTVIPPALISLSVGLAVLALADDLWHFLVAAVLGGMGHGGVVPSLQAVGINRTTRDRIPVATSTHFLALDAGIALGPVALGFIVQLDGYPSMFLTGSASMMFGLVLYWVVHGRRRATTMAA